MAYVEERKLDLGERNPTEIVARIDLDENYNSSIRFVTWSCYRVNDDGSMTLIKELSRTIPNLSGEEAYVFPNLTPNTLYYITAVISNINYGAYGDIFYSASQRTAISGGTIYPTEELAIIRFEVTKRQGLGFTVRFSVSGLSAGAEGGLVRLSWKRSDGQYGNSTEWETKANTLTETYMRVVGDYGFYTFTLVANIVNKETDETESIVSTQTIVFVDWQTSCQIAYNYYETKELVYDDGKLTVKAIGCVDISSVNWSIFCESINDLRDQYNLEPISFTNGRTLSAVMWNEAIDAFYEFCQFYDYSFNIDAYIVSRGDIVSKQLIDNVNDDILQILSRVTTKS